METKEKTQKLGELVTRLRKIAGVSQTELASAIGVYQSTLSRMEKGIYVVKSSELFEISRFFGVTTDSLFTGAINYVVLAEKFGRKTPLPKRYQYHLHSRVREVMPLLDFIGEIEEERTRNQAYQFIGVDLDYLMDPDQSVSSFLFFDLFSYLVKEKLLTNKNISQLAKVSHRPKIHGNLYSVYEEQKNAKEAIRKYCQFSTLYSQSFHFEYLDPPQRDPVKIRISPASEIEVPSESDEKLKHMLLHYQKEYLAGFGQYFSHRPVKLIEASSLGDSSTVFHLVK